MNGFEAVVGAGSLSLSGDGVVRFPHPWTDAGVTVATTFTGAHLLHLSVAGCVLNDVHREAARLGVVVDGVRVSASGGFDTDTWTSTGITYTVEIDSPDDTTSVLAAVDAVAEIPKAVRAGAPVSRFLDG
ncbi:OsmC family protein [Jatrophihabitans fulvus]